MVGDWDYAERNESCSLPGSAGRVIRGLAKESSRTAEEEASVWALREGKNKVGHGYLGFLGCFANDFIFITLSEKVDQRYGRLFGAQKEFEVGDSTATVTGS